MRIAYDIDGTLTHGNHGTDYHLAKPHEARIANMNRLFDAGHEIILHTGRHWDKLNVTVTWLERVGAKYTHLVMGKPPCDMYVDADAYHPDTLWEHKELRDVVQ